MDGGINTYSYGLNSPLNFIDPTGEAACGGACIFGAATAAMRYICKQNPKACKEFAKCITNPLSCKKRFCKKKPNKTYHGNDKDGVCEVPGCKPGDSTATAQFKKSAADICVVLRDFVALVCHNGKMDAEHKKRRDEAERKSEGCSGMCWF